LALLATAHSQAAGVDSVFTPLGGNNWSVDLTVFGDGTPASITGFTVYFAEAVYADLALAASPASWDSLAIAGDTAIPAPGFLDALVINAADSLEAGESQGGFRLTFTLASGMPGALPFDIVDSNFNVLASGMSQVTVVPEPASMLLTLLGLGVVGGAAARRTKPAAQAPEATS
jgi:hypothetical protein